MLNCDGDIDSLEQRHRKEKKELQAHVMALKKKMKGDKSRKKEITTEIIRLESELDQKHKNEREEISIKDMETMPQDVDYICSEDFSTEKISKAQKRRNKKDQEERDRNERIKHEEKENLHGPRTLETQEITSKLKNIKLNLHLIPSDGDCLYNAISHQLSETGRKVLHVEQLRTAASNYIRDNKDDFLPFMSNPDTFEMLSDSEFENYCHSVATTKTWGGQIEIRALSNVLKCPIYVVQGAGQDTVKQGEEMEEIPLVITYHRYMYSLGEHYNSSIKIPTEA